MRGLIVPFGAAAPLSFLLAVLAIGEIGVYATNNGMKVKTPHVACIAMKIADRDGPAMLELLCNDKRGTTTSGPIIAAFAKDPKVVIVCDIHRDDSTDCKTPAK